jgi:threonine synthase
MDVGAPSNFARILDMYGQSHDRISSIMKGYRFSDEEITGIIRRVYQETGYLLDPHGACGFAALEQNLAGNEAGVFLETAHPAKFLDTMEKIAGEGIVTLPEALRKFQQGKKEAVPMSSDFSDFRNWLVNRLMCS